jgi:hypothetical protein
VSFIRLGLARLRDERAGSAAFVLVVFVTAFLFSTWPRLYDRTRETALRSEVAAAPSSHRNIELSRQARIAGGGIDAVVRAGEQEEERLPREVRALIEARTFHVDSPRWLPAAPILWTTVILRIQDGLEERVRYLHGGPPAGGAVGEPGTGGAGTDDTPTFEAGLSVRAAERLGVTAEAIARGARMELRHDPTDTAARAGSTAAVRFTGIFEPTIPLEDDYWFDDPSAIVPRVRAISADDSFTDVAVILSPDAYTTLVQPSAGPAFDLRYAWRYFIDPERLAVDRLDRLTDDLRSMEGVYRDRDTQTGDATVNALRSRLLTLVESHVSSWRAADVALVTAGIGPVGLAGGAVGFVAVLSALRRTRLLRAAHARGAATSQMVTVTLAECLLLAVPAAVLAGVLAVALVPSPRLETTAARWPS